MRLGIDLSSLDELEKLKIKYYHKGQEIDPFVFFSNESHIKMVRIKLWHNPYDLNGNPYGGGTNDLACFLRLAKRAKEAGMDIVLALHYSDFWADPSRQKCPKAWEDLSFNEVLERVYEYTKETLEIIKNDGIDLKAIQVGNEITHGMIYPYGEIYDSNGEKEFNEKNGGGFKGHSSLLKQGIKACKEVFPKALTIIHLEHSGSHDMQDYYFDKLLQYGVEFDVIGESYYPFWHGPIKMMIDNVTKLMNKYHKKVWIVEMGYEFRESLYPHERDDFHEGEDDEFIVGNIAGRIPFPFTKEGQKDYLDYLLKECKKAKIDAVFYWEPCWIYLENNGWASDAGQIYCNLEPTKPKNDWCHETLFDFEGKANIANEVFNQDNVDNIK